MQGKQAKIVSPTQERAILGYLVTTRYPARDRVMFLLSMKAGLRAKEMAALTWAMVTDAQGQVTEVLHVPNRASKGKTGGRTIPLHPALQTALVTLQTARGAMATPERAILFSERGGGAAGEGEVRGAACRGAVCALLTRLRRLYAPGTLPCPCRWGILALEAAPAEAVWS